MTPTPAPAPAPSELDQAAASPTEATITGTVVFFSAEKGYGFIAAEGRDRDLYVNASELPEGRTTLARGAIVRCGTKEGDEGVEAARVEVVSEPEPSELEQVEEPTTTGTVKWFNSEKGFGFIATAGGDLFVSASQLPAGRATLAPGTTVRCGTRAGKKGKVAARVEVLSEPAPRPICPPARVAARPPSEPSELDLAVARIAEALGETEPQPLEQLRRIIGRLGLARVEELLARVEEIEAAGGMPVPDGSRRRTRGGVFFAVVRQSIPRKERGGLFVFPITAPTASLSTPPTAEALGELLADVARWPRGVAGSVKITLVGRPGSLQQTARPGQVAEFFAFPMESGQLPSLPKGLPIPTVPTTFLVLVSARQWRRVADALRNPQDRLIIEGHSSIDARVPDMITVRAISVTTVEAQRALRAKQQAESAQREDGETAE
jgi:cold shock CspA family protein